MVFGPERLDMAITNHLKGRVVYSLSNGKQSLAPESERPFQLDTICAIASMTKLMTVVAVMQCVEKGVLDLDKSVADVLPEVGKFGIITDFNDETNEASFKPNTTPITLRYAFLNNQTNII